MTFLSFCIEIIKNGIDLSKNISLNLGKKYDFIALASVHITRKLGKKFRYSLRLFIDLLLISFTSWMKIGDYLAQISTIQMGINFGGSDGLVA